MVSDVNTMFIDHIIFIMKNVLENKSDQPSEHLGVTSIEPLMLAIVRYINTFVNIFLPIRVPLKELCFNYSQQIIFIVESTSFGDIQSSPIPILIRFQLQFSEFRW